MNGPATKLVRFALVAYAVAAVPVAGQVADPKSDFVQALARFSLALEGAYGDEGGRIRSSLDAMDQGLQQWDASIRTYEAALASEIGGAEPQLAARMHAALGGIYLDRGRVEDALRDFAAASRLDPSRADVRTLQGLAYSHQLAKDPAAATRASREASALDPGDPVRAYVLARHLTKFGETEDAKAEAKKTMRLVRENQKLRSAEPGRTAVASPFIRLDLVQESARVEPFFPPVLYAEGFALLQRGDYPRAILQFREAATRDPLTDAAAETREAIGQATAAFRDGAVEVAVSRLKDAIELAPGRAESHRMLGRVYLANRQDAEGIDELRTAVRLSPGDERARLTLADALVERRQYTAAEQALRETIQVLPASGRARYVLGRLYQRQGQQPEALQAFGEAITFGPLLGLNGIYQAIGAINAARQSFDAAIDAYEKRVEVHPNDPDAHHDLGETYFRIGRHDEAMAEFAVVLMLNPKHSEAYSAMAQAYLRDGHYTDAAETARRALELDPAHKQSRYALATSLMRLGKTDEGKQELEVFQRLQGEETAARARQLELDGLRREAAVSSAKEDYEKAVALLRKALEYAPDVASSHLDLGMALVKTGRHAEAIERFKSAEVLNAPFDVHRHLAEAYSALGQVEESRRQQAIYERMKQESLRRAGANR